MRKLYKVFLLFLALIFLSTYIPNHLNISSQKENLFFKIKNIKIKNNTLISDSVILERLNYIYGKNILFLRKNNLTENLNSINFLDKVEVKKQYPNTIVVKIYETRPIAIVFIDNNKHLLDSLSNVIIFEENQFTKNLPSIFGKGAAKNFKIFLDELKNNNFYYKEIKNYYFFKIGRWDVELLNNKIIKFPVNNLPKAINKSVELLNRDDFKNYNVIDLRINDKIIVK